ncbi:MAG: SGNH/GDSL hydrolase family protein [Tunicatimonas sp.]
MKYLCLLTCLALVACQSSPNSVLDVTFENDRLPRGWKLVPAESNTSTNASPPILSPRQDAMPVQNGRLESPAFAVEPFQYYRVAMQGQAQEKTLVAMTFYDRNDSVLLADFYSSIDPSATLQQQVFYVQAKANAARAEFWFQPGAGQTAYLRQVRITPAQSPDEILRWQDSIYRSVPPLRYQPPAERWQHLPRTMQTLREGGTLRVVMLGNSIINDTGNSGWELPVEQHYPGADLQVITSVRGGTGCTYYQHHNRVDTFVVQYQPDLLMIGGISNNNDTASIHSVIRQVRERMSPAPDIMVLSGPLGRDGDPRTNSDFTVNPAGNDFRVQLARMCADAEVEYFDMKSAWGAYLTQSNASYDYYLRDPVHANSRGRQVLARMLAEYFAPQLKLIRVPVKRH